MTRTVVEILDKNLNKLTEVKALYPLTKSGMVLRYSRELSDYGYCTFRVSTKDPMLAQYGDILTPHAYHIRIKRGTTTVWQGGIIDNTERNKNYIEVRGAEYLYYLDKILLNRNTSDALTSPNYNIFRQFSSGTMAAAVTTIVNEAKTNFGSNHILASMTLGTIDNPDYPDNAVDTNGVALTGAWNFRSELTLQFDFHTVLYVLKAFGIYSQADFELTPGLVFNFQPLIGERITGVTFTYQTVGSNIVDYNLPRLGKRMANDLIGIAATDEGIILHNELMDTDSRQTSGLLQDVESFSDVKSQNLLNARLKEKLFFVKSPEDSPMNIVVDENAYFLGQYDIGDILWVKVKDHIIDFQKERRVVGFTVNLHNTGRELTTIQTNAPRPNLIGAS